ncbi:MAG: F0F1 ATP synthase subunit gamma [Proteobacteria bacterium]|jgi:F-type H+-transporting ATPase subunit gamma|nr:F0F1 ATP synthase subunit gamma [Alphaproteobacteria bacterium]NCC03182.1 F0F1 ATP synthase subunit gamma [Pseudomonadota bacterium]
MPSLKDLKNRIASVKSTRKITSAMKMVAASKLRRAQDLAEASRPYSIAMSRMLSNLVSTAGILDEDLPLLVGTGSDKTVLLIVMTSDRGLCGAFNGSIIRETRRRIVALEAKGKSVKLMCIGRKAYNLLHREHESKIIFSAESAAKKSVDISDAEDIIVKALQEFENGSFDEAYIVFNRFKSAISQVVTVDRLIPFVPTDSDLKPQAKGEAPLGYELFEPAQVELIDALLRRNLMVQTYAALLESSAGEQGARMTAMDNATRNAGDMIDRLTLNYNRSRQAYITKELIEIISGAEAV